MVPTKRYVWPGGRTADETDFTIPGAGADEITEVITVFVQTIPQYDNYVVTGVNVARDTIRFNFTVNKEDDVYLVYR